MNKRTIGLKNLELFYFDNEKEGPALLFIHGNSLNSNLFYRQFDDDSLSRHWIIAPDLPGHGRSGRSGAPEEDYAVSNYINILRDLILELGIKEVVIFGHSLGGHIAIHLIDELHNVEIKGLAIMGTPPLTLPPKMEEAFLPEPAMEFAFKPDLSDKEAGRLAKAFIKEGHKDYPLLKNSILTCDPLVRPYIGRSIATDVNNDESEILRNAEFPVAIFHGENDPLVNRDYIKKLTLPLWQNQIQTIEDAGHSAFLENPDRFNLLLSEFMEDCSND